MSKPTNSKSLRKSGALVRFKDMPARIIPIGDEHVTLVFESKELPPLILTNFEMEQAFGTILFFVDDRQPGPHSAGILTPSEIIEQNRIDVYIKTLNELMGRKKGGVGGKKVRKKCIEIASKKLNDSNPPSLTLLGNWAKDENTKIGGAKPKNTKIKHKRKSKFSDGVRKLALEVADEYFFKPVGQSMQYTYDKFVPIVKESFDDWPSRETFNTWLKSIIAPKELFNKKYSKTEIKKLLRNAVKKFMTKRPLERVEADGVYLQIGVVDEEDNYLGAVTIVFLLDVHTRCILGYEMHLGSGEPSSTIISAVRHAICPKTEGSYHTLHNNHWFCYGVPELFIFDGGPGFCSIETHGYILSYCGSIIETVASNCPWLKPFIERFNLTARQSYAKTIPGYVSTLNDQKKLEHDIKAQATLTIDALRRSLESWIVDEYHHTSHSGLNGKTPVEKWQEALDSGWVPEIPVDMDNVMLPAGSLTSRTISGDVCHLGVGINKIRYNDEEGRLKDIGLALLQQGLDPIVRCRYSDTDVYSITVIDPFTEHAFEVTTTHPDISPGTTLAEFEVKNPSTYKNKGYSHKRTVDENPEIIAGKIEHKSKTEKPNTKKIRKAIPKDYEDEVAKNLKETSQRGDGKSSSKSQYESPIGNIDLSNVKPHDES
jgi:hypothetical protein